MYAVLEMVLAFSDKASRILTGSGRAKANGYLLIFLFSTLLLSGCIPVGAKRFSEAPERPDRATVYIYSDFIELFRTDGFPVYLDKREVLPLKSRSYSVLYLKPGIYDLTTKKAWHMPLFRDVDAELNIPDTGVYFLKYEHKIDGFFYEDPDKTVIASIVYKYEGEISESEYSDILWEDWGRRPTDKELAHAMKYHKRYRDKQNNFRWVWVNEKRALKDIKGQYYEATLVEDVEPVNNDGGSSSPAF